MRMTVLPLGLMLALLAGPTTAEPRSPQEMKKKEQPKAQTKSEFFALFAVPVDPQIAEDEQLLENAKIATDGLNLLKFLVSRIPTDQDRQRLTPLIQQLGGKSFKIRDLAARELTAAGPVAIPLLRPLLKGPDLETIRRAQKIIADIEKTHTSAQVGAAVRLLRERKPQGAVSQLLQFLPHAGNELIEDEVAATVLTLTIDQKKVDPALTVALKDPLPQQRAVAALVLGREGNADQRASVRKLLTDKEAAVRFRAAQGLLCARDKSVVPVLVALLADGQFRFAEQAEDLLQRVAGEGAPVVALADNKVARAKGQEAWQKWWQDHEAKVDLTKSNTDLFFADMQQRSRDVTRQFLNSIIKADFGMWQKTTDVPFQFVGQLSFNTRDELDGFFKMVFEAMKDQIAQQKLSFKTGKVVTVEEYAKKSQIQERDYLLKLPASQTRIVLVSLLSGGGGGGPNEAFGIIVRVSGPRVRVIGFSQQGRN